MNTEPQYQHLIAIFDKRLDKSVTKYSEEDMKRISSTISLCSIEIKESILRLIYTYTSKNNEKGMYPYGIEWNNSNGEDIIYIELKNLPFRLLSIIDIYLSTINNL